ncbi:unnamed protein product [Diplocarpon coronariae]
MHKPLPIAFQSPGTRIMTVMSHGIGENIPSSRCPACSNLTALSVSPVFSILNDSPKTGVQRRAAKRPRLLDEHVGEPNHAGLGGVNGYKFQDKVPLL